MTQEDLISELKAIADEHWQANMTPILLSQLMPILVKRAGNDDFKAILGHQSLKSFIRSTRGAGNYQLIEHPTQIAKIALAPVDVAFEFPVSNTSEITKEMSPRQQKYNKALALLDILSTLPEQDLQQISIPVSVFVKLSKK